MSKESSPDQLAACTTYGLASKGGVLMIDARFRTSQKKGGQLSPELASRAPLAGKHAINYLG